MSTRSPVLRVERLEQRIVLDSTTVFNEILYHPASNESPEWIELHNQMAVDMDLSGWSLQSGVRYLFPQGTVIPGGEYLVVSSDPAAMKTRQVDSLGPFTGRLSDVGERLELRDNDHRLMSVVEYEDDDPWPAGADGSGSTMAKVREGAPSDLAENWSFSPNIGGTPGLPNRFDSEVIALAINEIASPNGDEFWLELVNHGDQPLDVGGVVLRSSDAASRWILPSRILAPGELMELTESLIGFEASEDEKVFLYAPGETTVLDTVTVTDVTQGRFPSAPGPWLRPSIPTRGQTNQFDLNEDIVINEIMYHAPAIPGTPGEPPEFLTSNFVALDATWRHGKHLILGRAEVPLDPGDGWYSTSHVVDRSDWFEGQSPFGAASGRTPVPIETLFASPLVNGQYITTYYFETEFSLPPEKLEDLDSLVLRHLVDDGAVFYLNGEEIHRFNMPEGVADANTHANADIGPRDLALSDSISIPTDLLVAHPATNRLSVEVHQASPDSDDIVFAVELAGQSLVKPGAAAVPFATRDEEWVELYNRGSETVDLSGWQLTDAIRYRFESGTTIAPDSYLVVASNANELRAKYPVRTNIVGDFAGTLSNSNDHILLLDSFSNPADEVHYYDGGRWDSLADGSGSSLELRDPRADNSQGQAWAASEEASKAHWQTYTYRGTAETTISGEPRIWREFAFGLLDGAGELLIDDISVVEDPSGEAIERIQNGSFDTGSAEHFRVLGNHQRSRMIDDGGNSVLHVVASGASEYQGNQIETTLATDTRIDADAEYEISFRAKWLSGSRQLNSRLYFNRLPKTTLLDAPLSNGTPGTRNSRFADNIGPTFDRLRHAPLVPSADQDVTISVLANDPDGIASMNVWISTDRENWLNAPMTSESGGVYSGTIPGLDAGTVVQFYIEAVDRAGATSTMPALGPNSRALYIVDDVQAENGPIHDFRLVMANDDTADLHRPTNVLSNERLGSTVIYNGEAFYDTAVRLKGSFVGRDAARVGFNIAFNPDQLFRGLHDKVAVDRSTHAVIGVDEILVKHAASHAGGIPAMYDDLIHFIAPRRQNTGTAALRMAGFDEVYLDSQFENGSDGTVFEYEVLRWATTTVDGDPESQKRAGSLGAPNGYANVDFRDLGDNKENYRWTNLIVSNRVRDDYDSIVKLGMAMSLAGEALDTATRQVMDVDQWMRTAAFQSLVGPGDAYFTGGNVHNFRLYVRPDGKVMYLPWDWDSAFQTGVGSTLIGGGRLGRVVRLPANLRTFYGHMLDIVESTWNKSYLETWANHYGELAGQNFRSRVSYIDRRSQFAVDRIQSDVPHVDFSMLTEGPLVGQTRATIQGKGWVNVRDIRVQGSSESLDASWSASTGNVADTWEVTIRVAAGSHQYTLEAFDHQGRLVGTDSIMIVGTGEGSPLDDLRISEIHYHPTDPSPQEILDGHASGNDFEFIELVNIGTQTMDLTDVRLLQIMDGLNRAGVTFDFSSGNIRHLPAGQRVVVVEDAAAFRSRYGDQLPVTGQWTGGLSNSSESITVAAGGVTVQQIVYRDSWHPQTDGGGFSLVAVDVGDPDPQAWNATSGWRPSTRIGGSPGAADTPAELLGDSNRDQVFNRLDIVQVLQVGKYQNGGPATWEDGDWNRDGVFDQLDIVMALQAGHYSD